MLALITPVLAAMIYVIIRQTLKNNIFWLCIRRWYCIIQPFILIFGHPEVYVVIIPAFGIVNMMLPYYNTRQLHLKTPFNLSYIYYGLYGFFLVWGHHMYLVGLDHRSRSLYSTVTVMISLQQL